MAENAALKSRVSDLERELEEALCKLKLGSVGGGAKVVTLALRSEGEGKKDLVSQYLFKEVQLDFTPEMQVLYMLFERYCTKNINISQTAYKILLNFRSKIQLDHPVILQELVSGVGEM